jgi:UPF0042 nucleotide-binding protein
VTEGPLLLVVVTGLSGAGKSTAINALEDLGFFCVDNLPTPVVASTLAACAAGGMQKVGLGIDVRVRKFLDSVASVLDSLPDGGYELQVVFLDASDEALLRRFSSTRRPHPLASSLETATSVVLDGIQLEREVLAPLRERATHVIDTTVLSVHDLRRRLIDAFGSSAHEPRLRVRIASFGFKYGTPVDADLVLDVRFLPNPFFVPELRDLTGMEPPVRDYVLAQADAQRFVELASELLAFCLPRYVHEGRAYLTVAIGCTGGRHRSVALAETLGKRLRTNEIPIEVSHRDVGRLGPPRPMESKG